MRGRGLSWLLEDDLPVSPIQAEGGRPVRTHGQPCAGPSVVAEEGQVRRAVGPYAELGAGSSLIVAKRQAQGAVASHTQPRPGAVPANEPEARRAVWQQEELGTVHALPI